MDELKWPLGEKKKLFYNKELGLNIFVQRVSTRVRRKFNTDVHMFKIIMQHIKKKKKSI